MQAELTISRKALENNINFFKSKSTSSFLCPMVKSNAYGVGDSLVVGELLDLGVSHFGVARVFEGERLRRAFPSKEFEILVFAPLCASNIGHYVEASLTPVVGTERDLMILSESSKEDLKALSAVHVKFDMGMTRLGFSFDEASCVKEALSSLGLSVSGLCGHFSQAAEVSQPHSHEQQNLEKLKSLASVFNLDKSSVHAPNSEALLSSTFEVGLRPGLSLYGLSSDSKNSEDSTLKPVLGLKAPLVHIRRIKAGTKISYGGTWTSPKDTFIGVLLIGYADGLPRGLSGKIKLGFEGESFQQVGRICMDYTMVDLGLDSSLKLGQSLTFFGESYQAQALSVWAEELGCISYELLVGLGNRLVRRVV